MDSQKQNAPFRHMRRVEFSDTDMAGIVHFANFFRYIEEAEHAFLRSIGLNVLQPIDDGVMSWPRVSVHCDFLKPARLGDIVAIDVSVDDVTTKSITYGFVMSVEGARIAIGRTVAVCCRVTPGQAIESMAIPQEIADKLSARRPS